MNSPRLWSLSLALFAASTSAAWAAESPAPAAKILETRRIWDRAEHNAFTDLIRFRDRWYCTFREGAKHVAPPDGTVRVLESSDGKNWESVASLQESGVDLRDPKFSTTPDGRLMLVLGGSYWRDDRYTGRQPRVAFSTDGRTWGPLQPVLGAGDWLWRITWFKGRAYGVSYYGGGGLAGVKREGFLYASDDGLKWDLVTRLDLPNASETTLRFLDDGEMIALSRSNLDARIGSSRPPYTAWTWRDAPHPLGGPNFIVLPDGRWIAGTGIYRTENKTRIRQTFLTWMTRDSLQPLLAFESAGDNSYPGLVWHNQELWMSYYSTHEGKSSIYIARVQLPPIGAADRRRP